MTHFIYDCWTSYGPRPEKDPEERWALGHLLEDLDFYGITRALVRHEQANFYDAMHCNKRLIREIAGRRDRLSPCWSALPHHCGDFPAPAEFVKAMDDNDVRAVYISPARHGYPVHRDFLAPLAEALNPRKTLILTTFSDLASTYQGAVDFCRIFENCPVLLAETVWTQFRLVLAIMQACPNARLEFHLFQANRAVEFMTERFGSDRMLFGSGLLRHSAGAARGFIDWSLLPEHDISNFAGKNLLRLMREDVGTAGVSPAQTDPLVIAASARQPLPMPVVDAHCHVLDEGLNGGGCLYVMPSGDCHGLVSLADHIGVKLTAVMSWSGTVCMDVRAGNDLIEHVVSLYPDKLVGLSSCDPTHQTSAEIGDMCRRLHLEKGFRGMKPYPYNNVAYDSELYELYWQFCNEYRLYALLHTRPELGGVDAVCKIAQKHPDATFLIAHSGGSWPLARQVRDAVLKYKNIMAELTLTPVPNGIIEWLCSQIGPERILFGTDAPMRDPRPQLGWCVYTRLNFEQKTLILGMNFARILKRCTLPQALPLAISQ
jgi:predicted TIM-barrel fold metal-dependent hydrolase